MKSKILIPVLAILISACNAQKKAGGSVVSFDRQGHRGCRGLMPENTIPAMIKGMDLGATRLEMDVVISKDKQVVISHDFYFHETLTTTPDGKTLTKEDAEKLLLYNMTYDSISRFDVGLKPHPDFPQQQKMPAYKPLLGELLDATEKHAKETGKPITYNIEIKSKPEFEGKKQPPVEEIVDLTMKVVKQKGIESRTLVQSFDPRAIQVMHRKYPHIATGLLIDGKDKRSIEEQLQQLGYTPDAYNPHFSLVTQELVDKCHQKNIKINPWTVNTSDEMKRLINLKVDGIITDYPNLFSALN